MFRSISPDAIKCSARFFVYCPIPVSGESNAAPLSPTTSRSAGFTLRLEDQRRFDKADRRRQISTRSTPCCGSPNQATSDARPSVLVAPHDRIRSDQLESRFAVTEVEGSASLDEIVKSLGREGAFVRWIRKEVDTAHKRPRNFDHRARPGNAPNFFDSSNKVIHMLKNITAKDPIPLIVGKWIGKLVQVVNDVRVRSSMTSMPIAPGVLLNPQPSSRTFIYCNRDSRHRHAVIWLPRKCHRAEVAGLPSAGPRGSPAATSEDGRDRVARG